MKSCEQKPTHAVVVGEPPMDRYFASCLDHIEEFKVMGSGPYEVFPLGEMLTTEQIERERCCYIAPGKEGR